LYVRDGKKPDLIVASTIHNLSILQTAVPAFSSFASQASFKTDAIEAAHENTYRHH
jgi:hypothetical protein